MQEVYAEYERTTREHIVDEVEQALAEAKVGTSPRVPDGATVTGPSLQYPWAHRHRDCCVVRLRVNQALCRCGRLRVLISRAIYIRRCSSWCTA